MPVSYGGFDQARINAFWYVHEHHTSGVTTIYNERGKVLHIWGDNDGEEMATLAQIIQGSLDSDRMAGWDGTFPKTTT